MSDIHKNFVEYIDANKLDDIRKLYKNTKKGYEFEFIFFSKKNKFLSQEKYIQLLKFMSKRAKLMKLAIVKPHDSLDMNYAVNSDLSYRCTIGESEINNIMKKMSLFKNHVIFKTIASLWKKKNANVSFIKKEKNANDVIDIDDFDMRIRLSKESELTEADMTYISEINDTHMKNINFRSKQRTSLYVSGNETSDEFIRIDLTYTRTNDIFSKLNTSIPNYELEIEYGTKKVANKELLDLMFSETELLLKIINQSNYIISKTVSEGVIDYYKQLLSLSSTDKVISIAGRKSVTLEIQHISELPNKYAVTEKADGERTFMIIKNNHVFFISQTLTVRYSGIVLSDKLTQYNGSLVDGELIFIGHKNRYLFLIFDCLFYKSTDVRPTIKLLDRLAHADDIVNNCFIFGKQKGYKPGSFTSDKFNLEKKLAFHFNEICAMIKSLNNDMDIEKQYPLIRRKYFTSVVGAKDWEIFAYASTTLNAFANSTGSVCPYLLDGLIFQPLDQSYAANTTDSGQQDYKWKPPTKNSIDFYIEFEKDNNGSLLAVYDNSNDTLTEEFVRNKPYRICKLHVGQQNKNYEIPVKFMETEQLYLAYLYLNNGEARDIEGNILMDKTVVEFYYNDDPTIADKFKWVPIRTRYDKTELVVRFGRQYGNYHTIANKIWRSIVNPIVVTDFDELSKGGDSYNKKMGELKKNIGHDLIVSTAKDNAYFQKKSDLAKHMKSFNNFIKSNLIYTFCHPMYQDNKQMSVLDLACGRGSDNMRFYYSMVSIYVGIDIDSNGLVSPVDGAISRYNQMRKKRPNFPKMYFMQADATVEFDLALQRKAFNLNKLENDEYFPKFFSKNPKERATFDRINCQFAIHYMLRNEDTWKNFKTNINNYLRTGGYLLLTTFDGGKVRKLLKDKQNVSYEYNDANGKTNMLFDIVKKYAEVDDSVIMGVGNPIDVYISWFSLEGRYLTEYIVDSRFLIQQLKDDCGMDLVDTDDFENQYVVHKPFVTKYSKYEEIKETREFIETVGEYYKQQDAINKGCKIYNDLTRYYIFRKQDVVKTQIGGNSIDFTDSSKFSIPHMDGYNVNYSCINSIHHILQSHKIIPKYVSSQKFCEDMKLSYIDDDIVDKKISHIAENITIKHSNDRQQNKNYLTTVINGLNIFIIERDCNDTYEIELIRSKKVQSEHAIILMKESTWYVPIYNIDCDSQKKVGLFNMDDPLIVQLMEEL